MKMKGANELRIIAKASPGVSPEHARDARAHAWRFVFDCWEQKKAAGQVGGDEHARKESKDVSRNRTISQP
jgi:hypothetical protein